MVRIVSNSILELEMLRKNFGGVVAVSDITLNIEKGSITSLIGPNGAGKTTIFNLVTGLLAPTSGQVRFAGRVVNQMKPYTIASIGIGRTFQNVQIFPKMSVIENRIKNEEVLKKWKAFKSHRTGYLSVWIILISCFFSFTAEFWANSKPIYLSYKGESYFPVFKDISEQSGLISEPSWKYGGPTIADIDNNGYYDLILNNHDKTPTKLFLQKEKGKQI